MKVEDKHQLGIMNVDFVRTVSHKYRTWCKRMETSATLEGFARWLLERDVIRQRTACRYMAYIYYPSSLYENDYRKKAACLDVSIKTGISERTIWTMIKHRPDAFKPGDLAWASAGAVGLY